MYKKRVFVCSFVDDALNFAIIESRRWWEPASLNSWVERKRIKVELECKAVETPENIARFKGEMYKLPDGRNIIFWPDPCPMINGMLLLRNK